MYDSQMSTETKWKEIEIDTNETDILSDKLNITPLLAKVLLSSGFTLDNIEEIERFINPKMEEILTYSGISSPEELEKSIQRIKKAIKNKEKVMINGDPDADGISGTTILTAALRHFGLEVEYSFPIRSVEGHGLQIRIIQDAIKNGCSLVITTDCGTKDVEAVDYANEKNIDVIITDHHILGKKLPNATAIINPYVNTNPTEVESRYLSGSYVAFKWALALKDALKSNFPKEIFECLVICAALGALSDRISLKKPMNRAVIKLGIDYLNTTKLAGMKALKEISIPKRSSLTLRAREISRTIAPRMNAPGRIGNPALNIPDSSIVVDLLIAGLSIGPRSDIKKFIEKYKKLLHQDKLIKSNLDINDQVEIVDEVNSQRKRMTEEIETKIEELLQSINLSEEKVVIVKGQNWNSGVIGIDADRLKDRLMKPAIVMTSLEGSEYLKGSVRSLKSINMYEIMEKTQIAFEQKIGHNPYQVKVNTQLGERFVNAFMDTHKLVDSPFTKMILINGKNY